ncbi:hypothetical protein [Chitinophaga sp.]|uniref:hypothetical protein n=1 Tax=Chitinophaga sp. TaxID=1869181 RepID=UPI0031D55514
MRKKHPFILCSLLLSYFYADAQTLEQVTTNGNTTTKSISISNEQGLSIGVDAATGYTIKSHFIRPFNATYRTLRFDCSTVDANGGWEFYNSGINTSLMYIKQGGNIGIGTTTPQAKLEVNGDIKSSNGIFRALTGTLPNDIMMSYGYNTTVGDYTSLKVAGATANTAELRLVQNGNVGIGTQNPQSKLAVNGTITATRLRVTQSGWADFVFQDGYHLPSLTETEAFIKKNKRLPDMPSEEQVKANGVDVADTQAKLLQKIEELTLHLIELNNKVTAQQQLLAEQSKEIKRLKK